MKLTAPKRRISIEEFYDNYLPGLFAELFGTSAPPWDLRLGVAIDDEQFFEIRIADGALSAASSTTARGIVSYHCNKSSWEIGVGDLLPQIVRHLNKHTIAVGMLAKRAASHPRVVSFPTALAELPGCLTIHYTDDAGDTASFELRIAGGRGPRVTVEASDPDLWALLNSGGKIIKLVRSRARVTGDIGYLLRLARLVDTEG